MDGKVCPVVGAEPGQSDVQGSAYLLLKYGYESSHLWRNFGIMIAMMIIFCTIYLIAAQYIPAQRSKGEVLLFQHGHSKKQLQRAPDSEKAVAALTFAQDINKREDRDVCENDSETMETILQQSSVFHWNSLSYEVATKNSRKKILDNISGWVKPGTLTALMVIKRAIQTGQVELLG